MDIDYTKKSTIEEIRERFDHDVERFSNLETGQANMIDAALTMDLCTEAAKYSNPEAKELLDIGCGAGNYTLKMLSKIPGLNCTLNDLSMPMLERAQERVAKQITGTITIVQDDMRNLNYNDGHFDIVLAAATFHHLRDDEDWKNMFRKIYNVLKSGGCLWISDIVAHDISSINSLFQKQMGDHLENIGGPEYRKKVMDYVDHEDSPRSLNFQMQLLKEVGFSSVEILHKNGNVAAFGGIK
jgi:tRNA (cmo5U34)-methyltransferase